MRRLLWMAGALLAAIAPVPAAAAQQPAAVAATSSDLSAEQWREDLSFMVAEMRRRHPNLYHKVSKDVFDRAVADLDRRIPALQRNQIIAGMMRIAALVGDGHTRMEPRKDTAFQFRSLPLKLFLFDDGVFVWAARQDQARLVGARVEAIGGIAVDEAVRRVSELASRENAIGPKLYAPIYLGMPDILHALGLSDSRDSAVMTMSRDGERWTVRVPVGDVAPRWPPDTDISLSTPEGWVDARRGPAPLWLQAPLDYHRLIDLPERRALYAQLNMVSNVDGQTLDQFGEKIRARSAALNPRALVLDLRLNQGGNGMLRTGLVRSLIKAEDDDTRLYVLTARGTYSASQFILNDLERLTDSTLVGEPAASRPTHYGDSYRSVLPNSGLTIRTSILYWKHEQDERDWNAIDVSVPYRFADYAAGRDPVLEAALSDEVRKPLAEQLVDAAKGASAKGRPVGAESDAVAALAVNRYNDVEGAAIDATFQLANGQQGAEALALSRWTAARFPTSALAALVLAMMAESQGLNDEARKAAATTLRLDPNNRNARSLLQRLGQ